ncbi:unnamed protein product [Schistocephalus solidus]|uniref:Uncharacterized protein n=1 Tax=Schistocephalus solidus TaxID=70667 RepID=A0A183T0E7_SCHSO|nr:unnamed protein product [Schistocephalus solidus]
MHISESFVKQHAILVFVLFRRLGYQMLPHQAFFYPDILLVSLTAFRPACTHRSTDPSTPPSAALSASASTTTSDQSPMLLEAFPLKLSLGTEEQQQQQANEDVFFAFDMHVSPPTSYFDSLPTSRCAALQASLHRPRTHPALTNVVTTSPGLLQPEASHLRVTTAGLQHGRRLHTCPRVRGCTAHSFGASHHRPTILRLLTPDDAGGALGGDSQTNVDGGGRSGGGASAACDLGTACSRGVGLSAGGGGGGGFSGSVSSGFQSHSLNSSVESSAATNSGDGMRVLTAPVSQSPERPADSHPDWPPFTSRTESVSVEGLPLTVVDTMVEFASVTSVSGLLRGRWYFCRSSLADFVVICQSWRKEALLRGLTRAVWAENCRVRPLIQSLRYRLVNPKIFSAAPSMDLFSDDVGHCLLCRLGS